MQTRVYYRLFKTNQQYVKNLVAQIHLCKLLKCMQAWLNFYSRSQKLKVVGAI